MSLNPEEKAKANPKSRKYAIKAHCYDCSGDNLAEVTRCVVVDCPLYKFRKG